MFEMYDSIEGEKEVVYTPKKDISDGKKAMKFLKQVADHGRTYVEAYDRAVDKMYRTFGEHVDMSEMKVSKKRLTIKGRTAKERKLIGTQLEAMKDAAGYTGDGSIEYVSIAGGGIVASFAGANQAAAQAMPYVVPRLVDASSYAGYAAPLIALAGMITSLIVGEAVVKRKIRKAQKMVALMDIEVEGYEAMKKAPVKKNKKPKE